MLVCVCRSFEARERFIFFNSSHQLNLCNSECVGVSVCVCVCVCRCVYVSEYVCVCECVIVTGLLLDFVVEYGSIDSHINSSAYCLYLIKLCQLSSCAVNTMQKIKFIAFQQVCLLKK